MTAIRPPPWRGIRAVLFDFDGTLFDSFDAIVFAFNAALERHGRPPAPRDRIAALIGRPLAEMFPAIAADADPAAVEALIEAYREAFLPICVPMSRLLPGARETVAALRDAGLLLGIATNRTGAGARYMLRGFGLDEAFQDVVGFGDVARGKPDPESLRRLMRTFDARPEETIMVGDAPLDIEAGRNAGALTVGIPTGHYRREDLAEHRPDALIARLDDLPALLAP